MVYLVSYLFSNTSPLVAIRDKRWTRITNAKILFYVNLICFDTESLLDILTADGSVCRRRDQTNSSRTTTVLRKTKGHRKESQTLRTSRRS